MIGPDSLVNRQVINDSWQQICKINRSLDKSISKSQLPGEINTVYPVAEKHCQVLHHCGEWSTPHKNHSEKYICKTNAKLAKFFISSSKPSLWSGWAAQLEHSIANFDTIQLSSTSIIIIAIIIIIRLSIVLQICKLFWEVYLSKKYCKKFS